VGSWDGYPNENSRPYEKGFAKSQSIDPWWDKLRRPNTPGSRPLPGPPTESRQWVRWGGKAPQSPLLTVGGEVIVVQFEQILDARLELPTGWLLGLSFELGGDALNPDTAIVEAQALWGLGAANFRQVVVMGGVGPGVPSLFQVVGPVPAETLVVSGTAVLTGSLTGTYPHNTPLVFGAFAAPQVWP
jgi:hypothetical protein